MLLSIFELLLVHAREEQYSPQRDVPDMEQRSLGKRLGCKSGYIGSGFGLLSALIMKGTPLRDTLTLLCGFISIGACGIFVKHTSPRNIN